MIFQTQSIFQSNIDLKDHLTDREVAKIFNISVRTLRNKICRGEAMPRFYKPAGFRNRIWLKTDVFDFIDFKK